MNKNKNKSYYTTLGVIIGVFVVATVYFAIATSSLGATLVSLESQKNELLAENRKLSAQLVESSSLTLAGERAEELGFIKPSNIIYLDKQESVAKLP